MRTILWVLAFAVFASAGCGGAAVPDGGQADVGAPDVAMSDGRANDDAASGDAAPDATAVDTGDTGGGAVDPLLHDCTTADYDDRSMGADEMRTVVPMGSTGYAPRCVSIASGQAITFSMDFMLHPLAPGIAHGSSVGATMPNPIPPTRTGTSTRAVFTTPGYYPFFCSIHGHVGMAGVVRVRP